MKTLVSCCFTLVKFTAKLDTCLQKLGWRGLRTFVAGSEINNILRHHALASRAA